MARICPTQNRPIDLRTHASGQSQTKNLAACNVRFCFVFFFFVLHVSNSSFSPLPTHYNEMKLSTDTKSIRYFVLFYVFLEFGILLRAVSPFSFPLSLSFSFPIFHFSSSDLFRRPKFQFEPGKTNYMVRNELKQCQSLCI